MISKLNTMTFRLYAYAARQCCESSYGNLTLRGFGVWRTGTNEQREWKEIVDLVVSYIKMVSVTYSPCQ